MRAFFAVVILAAFIAPAASLAGSAGDFDQPQQQTMPQTKVILVPPTPSDGDTNESWLVPVAVAAVGAVGIIGAAYVSRRKD
jgi:hypothetical protein